MNYSEISRILLTHPQLNYKEKIVAWHLYDRTHGEEIYKDPMWVTATDTGICFTSVHLALKGLRKKGFIQKISRDYHGIKYKMEVEKIIESISG